MNQFVVPQFIDVEDKIFGPVTVRQFLILLGTGVILFICFKVLELYAFALSALILGGGALIFAFVKVRGQTFHYFLLNFVQYIRKPARRIWKKEYTNEELKYYLDLGKGESEEEVTTTKQVKREHIRQLSLMVNTGGYYQAEIPAEDNGLDDIHIG